MKKRWYERAARGGTRRSREGAWIEILEYFALRRFYFSRSREGAWIEIKQKRAKKARALSRSREGAWIEICGQKWQKL